MANLTSVGITAGVPSSGTGTVSTIDNLIGTAGTPSASALTVQGATSMTALKVDPSAVTSPVSLASVPSHAVTNAGTFATQSAATQSGTWTVQPGNTANTTAWKVDNTAALDKGAGTGGSATQRVIIDSSQSDGSNYETVAASQTDQAMGATGATGDFLGSVLIVPATTSPGAVSIKDGSGSAITIFTGGATSVSNLAPIAVPLGYTSTGGAWKLTTGTNVSAIGAGRFT